MVKEGPEREQVCGSNTWGESKPPPNSTMSRCSTFNLQRPSGRLRRSQARLRLALVGPSGSGKTFALAIASGLGKMIAVLDTERWGTPPWT